MARLVAADSLFEMFLVGDEESNPPNPSGRIMSGFVRVGEGG